MQDSSYMLRAVLIVVPGVILFAAYAIARRGGDGSLSNGSAQTDAIAEAIRNSGDTEDQRASNGEDPTSCLLLAELHVYGAPEVGNRSGPVNTNGEPCWLEIVIYFPSEGGDCMPFVLPRRELSPAACTVLVADLPQIQAGFRGHLLGEFVFDNDAFYDLFQDDFGTGTTYNDRLSRCPSRVEPWFRGDYDCDGDVDLDDFSEFESCLLGPTGGLGPGCWVFDWDSNGDVDLFDFANFQEAFTGL